MPSARLTRTGAAGFRPGVLHPPVPDPRPRLARARALPWSVLVDDWGRWVLRTYFLGSIATLVSFTLMTMVADFPGPYVLAVLLAAAIVPLTFLAVGLRLRLRALREGRIQIRPVDPCPAPGWRGHLSQMRWLLATLGMFAAWPGFYFLASQVASLRAPVAFHFRLDQRLPLVTPLAPVYITVYWFFIFPALYGRERHHLRSLLTAYGILMLTSALVFIAYPVIYPRQPLAIHHLGDWALAIVQGADPPINCFPSSHCAVATMSALALREVRPSAFPAAAALAVAIVVATVLTKQHYVVDSVAGVALGAAAWRAAFHSNLSERVWSGVSTRTA